MVNFKENENLNMLNHSCAHLLAQAVKHLYPQAKFWVGPSIAEGFYYDIDLGDDVITEADLESIEKEMKKCSKSAKNIVRHELSKEEAKKLMANDPYKVELIEAVEGDTVHVYDQGGYLEICRGPHMTTTKKSRYFKLLSIAGAYWRGDSDRQMLQRIYGTAFPTQEELDALVEELKEAIEALEEKVEDTPVVEPEDKPEGPGTGDSTNTAGLLALLLASIYVLLNRRKKA